MSKNNISEKELNFEDFYTSIQDEKYGKFISIYHTPSDEEREECIRMNALEPDSKIFPLNEALDYVERVYPERKAVFFVDTETISGEVREYIRGRGFNIF